MTERISAGEPGVFTVEGLQGHWHRDLSLPRGYQHFGWFSEKQKPNEHGVYLNDVAGLRFALGFGQDLRNVYLYTHHEIFYQDGIIKQTRSSPNWESGLVTYATCKHLMRSYDRGLSGWVGTWLMGLCPSSMGNCVLFAGKVSRSFSSNYALRRFIIGVYPDVYKVKRASTNPRGDLYTPVGKLEGLDVYDHWNFVEPENHTRSLEFYSKSPGSVSEREDGKSPKWWRDIEYEIRGRRPPSFILSPCWLFSRPMLKVKQKPGRAVLRLTPKEVLAGLSLTENMLTR
jgi:hypothetical protein